MKSFIISIPGFDWNYDYSKKKFGFGFRLVHFKDSNYTKIQKRSIWFLGFLFMWGVRFKER